VERNYQNYDKSREFPKDVGVCFLIPNLKSGVIKFSVEYITLGFSLGNSRRLKGYTLNPRLKPVAINIPNV
jgi:hypothetical protein